MNRKNALLYGCVILASFLSQAQQRYYYGKDCYQQDPLLEIFEKMHQDNALRQAAKDNNFEEVQELVTLKANVNARDELGKTPLMYTTDINIVNLLLNNGADPNIQDKNGQTALMITDDLLIAKALVEAGTNLMIKNNKGENAYYISKAKNRKKIDEYLTPFYKNNKDPKEQLWLAAKNNNFEEVKKLVELKTDVNAQDGQGMTALMLTSEPEIVEFLLDHGADPDIQNYFGETALQRAHKHEFDAIDIVKLLLIKNADPNIQNKHGDTALILSRKPDIAKLLLQHKADPNIQNDDGETALIYAVGAGRIAVVKILVESRANLGIKNKKNQTAYEIAKNNIKEYEKMKENRQENKEIENYIKTYKEIEEYLRPFYANKDLE